MSDGNICEMEARAIRALQATWEAIGADALAANGGRDLTAEDVRDFVAGSGFAGGLPETYGRDRVAVLWLEKQPEAEQDRILQLAFPLARYGL
jgi:hypothetical protein